MDATAAKRYIEETFDGVRAVEHAGDAFFVHDPDGDLADDRWLPFATIVTGDHYEAVSGLDHPGAYRINIGLTKDSYTKRFGPAPTTRDESGVLVTGFDYAARDQVMPHPHYASQHWVCVVNPGPETADEVRRLLDEAHRFAARKHANQKARKARS
ncbi:DUF6194 family protein [Saccharopolyspora sp. NPDC050642]|uniref:DUF6194 family protein n=1 Tax=Saccharopolyspora sp. NPDC050642 TaxID=3157099 RepID=UPI0033D8845C